MLGFCIMVLRFLKISEAAARGLANPNRRRAFCTSGTNFYEVMQ